MRLYPTDNLINVYKALTKLLPPFFQKYEKDLCIIGSVAATLQDIDVVPNDVDISINSHTDRWNLITHQILKHKDVKVIDYGNGWIIDIDFLGNKIQLLRGIFSDRPLSKLETVSRYGLKFFSLQEINRELDLTQESLVYKSKWGPLYSQIEAVIKYNERKVA